MRHTFLLLTALLVAPAFVHANSSIIDVSAVSCTGSASFSQLTGASFVCTGNYSLIGGTLVSDSKIAISAKGDLFLDQLSITAPIVQLTVTDGTLWLGSGVSILAGSFLAGTESGTLPPYHVATGATLTLSEGGSSYDTGTYPDYIPYGSGFSITAYTPSATDITLSPVPEPAQYLSTLIGLIALASIRSIRQRLPQTS